MDITMDTLPETRRLKHKTHKKFFRNPCEFFQYLAELLQDLTSM